MDTLQVVLENFKIKVNSHEDVLKLMSGWNPNVLIECSDTQQIFTLKIRSIMNEILSIEENSTHEIRLIADKEKFVEIFQGIINPAEAVLNGDMMVFGDTKDQMRLDAITLLIWGM